MSKKATGIATIITVIIVITIITTITTRAETTTSFPSQTDDVTAYTTSMHEHWDWTQLTDTTQVLSTTRTKTTVGWTAYTKGMHAATALHGMKSYDTFGQTFTSATSTWDGTAHLGEWHGTLTQFTHRTHKS